MKRVSNLFLKKTKGKATSQWEWSHDLGPLEVILLAMNKREAKVNSELLTLKEDS